MCYAAIALSGIGNIVYAYEDAMGGGTSCNMGELSPLYRDQPIMITSGVMRNQSIELFQKFFLDPEKCLLEGEPAIGIYPGSSD